MTSSIAKLDQLSEDGIRQLVAVQLQLRPRDLQVIRVGRGRCAVQAPLQALHHRLLRFLQDVKLADVLDSGQTPLET